MDANLAAVPESGGGVSPPPPPMPLTEETLLGPSPLRLRPLWVGLAMLVAGFLLFAVVIAPTNWDATLSAAALCSSPVFVYYLMIVHRIVRVVRARDGGSFLKYTPAAAVWKHFVPFYGIYFLYRWPCDVEKYVNWRLGTVTHFAAWTFVGLLTGHLLGLVDPFFGNLVIFSTLYLLYVPLRRAITDEPTPGRPSLELATH
jgi:hypothetical protein